MAKGGTVPPIIIVTLRKSGRDDYDEGRLARAGISAALRGASIRPLSSFLTVPILRWFYISLLANRIYIQSASVSKLEQAQSGQRFCPDNLRYNPPAFNFKYFTFASSHVVSLNPSRCNTRSIPSPRFSCRTAQVSRKICADTCFFIPAFSAVSAMRYWTNRRV